MKRCQTLLFVILFSCVCIFGCDEGQQIVESIVEPPAAVDLIPDPNLAAAVRETLGLTATTPLTAEVLQNLRTLVAPDRQIVDLTGIEHAVDLVALDLSSLSEDVPNQISDVSPLAHLIKLTDLYLYENQISDISPLANLTNLTVLGIDWNQISDISPLANLTNLTDLGLGANRISDISPLAHLIKLTDLWLYSNQISDISPLAHLTNLTTLRMERNPLDDAAINTHIPALQERGVEVEH